MKREPVPPARVGGNAHRDRRRRDRLRRPSRRRWSSLSPHSSSTGSGESYCRGRGTSRGATARGGQARQRRAHREVRPRDAWAWSSPLPTNVRYIVADIGSAAFAGGARLAAAIESPDTEGACGRDRDRGDLPLDAIIKIVGSTKGSTRRRSASSLRAPQTSRLPRAAEASRRDVRRLHPRVHAHGRASVRPADRGSARVREAGRIAAGTRDHVPGTYAARSSIATASPSRSRSTSTRSSPTPSTSRIRVGGGARSSRPSSGWMRRSSSAKLRGSWPGDRFEYLARQVEPKIAAQVKALDLPGIYLRGEPKRYYPGGQLASHVLGFVDIDGEGLEGIESQYEEILKGEPGSMTFEQDPTGRALPQAEFSDERPAPGRSLVPDDRQGAPVLHAADARARPRSATTRSPATAIVMKPKTGRDPRARERARLRSRTSPGRFQTTIADGTALSPTSTSRDPHTRSSRLRRARGGRGDAEDRFHRAGLVHLLGPRVPRLAHAPDREDDGHRDHRAVLERRDDPDRS